MRYLSLLEVFRDRHAERQLYGCNGDDDNGLFRIRSEEGGGMMLIIASVGEGWEHVSVSLKDRCPTWGEMEQVAKLFFGDWETAMQLHVPSSDHINCHKYCLHWWRPVHANIPRPPAHMVGPKTPPPPLTPQDPPEREIEDQPKPA